MADAFQSFYKEVKTIEQKDAVYTSDKQISRLLRPGSTYANLNPFEVLLLDPEAKPEETKKQYKKLSILLHPDKNPEDRERAQTAFDILNKAYKVLEDESSRAKAMDVYDEAKHKVKQTVEDKKKKLRKEKRDTRVDEDDPAKFKQAVKVMTIKLFADYERKRKTQEDRAQEERKRKREGEIAEEEAKEQEKEWNKNYEESRESRVSSWQSFQKGTGKKAKVRKDFRPPSLKPETKKN